MKQENIDLKDEIELALDVLKGVRETTCLDDIDYLTDETKKEIKEFAEKLSEEVEE
ncbi:MAG: hypothetical protein ACLVK5_00145 [Peptoniphilus senegalensis]